MQSCFKVEEVRRSNLILIKMADKKVQQTVQGIKDTTTEKASQATKTTKGVGQSAIDATKGTGQPKGMGQSAIDTTKGIGQSAMGMGQSAFDATKGMGQSAMGMGQSAMDATMGMGRSAMEATKGMGQSVMGTGQQGKEQTGSALQQGGDTVKGASQTAVDAVKSPFVKKWGGLLYHAEPIFFYFGLARLALWRQECISASISACNKYLILYNNYK